MVQFYGKDQAHPHGLKLVFRPQGNPLDNSFIESFSGRLRDGMPFGSLLQQLRRCANQDRGVVKRIQSL